MIKTKFAAKIILFIMASGLLVLNLTTTHVRDMDTRIWKQLDHNAGQYIDVSLKQAMIAFGVTRAMNAAISFLQETTIAVQPLGVGVILAVGQVLDPLNDMVERASWVFLASATSLGVQRLFLQINQWIAVWVLVNGFLFCVLISIFPIYRNRITVILRSMVFKFALLILFIRCFIPVSCLISHHLYEVFMHETYVEQMGILNEQKKQMDDLSGGFRESVPSREQISSVFRQMSDFVSGATERLIELIVIFTVQVIILPLVFLWIFLQGIQYIFGLNLDFSTTLWQDSRHGFKKQIKGSLS